MPGLSLRQSVRCPSPAPLCPPHIFVSLPTDTALDLEPLPAPHSSAQAPQSNDIAKTLFPTKVLGYKFCFVHVYVYVQEQVCADGCVEIRGQL